MSDDDVTDLNIGIVGDSEWRRRWREGESHWHRDTVDPFLEENGSSLFGDAKGRIFVPLCGKSLDLLWLYGHGLTVVGVEIAEQPVVELFKENNIDHIIEDTTSVGKIYRSSDGRLSVFVASIFRIPEETLGKFDFIWDKASFTAINLEDRKRYRDLIYTILKPGGVSYLKTLEYDETVWPGPPHSASDRVVRETFGDACDVKLLEEKIPKGFGPTRETANVDTKVITVDEGSDKTKEPASHDSKNANIDGDKNSGVSSSITVTKEEIVSPDKASSKPEVKKSPAQAAISTSKFRFDRWYKLLLK